MREKYFVPILIIAFFFIGAGLAPHRAEANWLTDLWQSVRSELKLDSGVKIPGGDVEVDNSPVAEEIKPPVELYKPVEDYENAVIVAVDKATPSVVSIIVTKDLPVVENCPYDPLADLPPEIRDQFNFGGGVFSRPCQKGTRSQEVGGGSGFIISADGMIITNKHVVEDKKAAYTVLTNDGTKYPATVLARDPALDLAVVKIQATGLKTLKLGDSDSVKLGQTAIAIGNALGEFRNTVSVGVISGTARTITASGGLGGAERIEGVFQTDAAINPGNSGGPLLNLKGEVIAINVAVASGAQGIGFAIPINRAKSSINSVKTSGKIITPYLGVRYVLLDEELAEEEGLKVKHGAWIRGDDKNPAVLAGSPADKVDLKSGDVIVAINGEEVNEEHSLAYLVGKYKPGDVVELKIKRGEVDFAVRVELAGRES